jgi:hypothetical protein
MMAEPLRLPYRLLRGRLSPVVRVILFHNRAYALESAYVDTGAAYSIFTPDVAEELSMDWRSGYPTSITGLEGRRVILFLHSVGLRIGDFHIRAEVGFSDQLGIGFNLLGRHSIFNQLQFCFNDRDGELLVSRL